MTKAAHWALQYEGIQPRVFDGVFGAEKQSVMGPAASLYLGSNDGQAKKHLILSISRANH